MSTITEVSPVYCQRSRVGRYLPLSHRHDGMTVGESGGSVAMLGGNNG